MMQCCPRVSLVDVFIVLVLQLANQLFLLQCKKINK